MGALRRAGHTRGAVQGRPGLHRPRVSRAGHRAAGPQPGPGARRRRADRPAVPARQRGRRHRGRRGRDGTVRRPHRRRTASGPRGAPPRRSPGCSARRWCSSSTPAGRARASPHCCTASRPSIRSVARSSGVILNRVGSTAARRRAAPGVRTRGRSGARRHPADRRIGRAVKASRPGDGRRARASGAAGRRRDDGPGGPPRRRRGGGARCSRPRRRRAVGPRPSPNPSADGVTVALAAGKAFSFGYPEHAELLQAAGADVVRVRSADRTVARGHRGAGAARRVPRRVRAPSSPPTSLCAEQLRALAATGAPIHAECAGLTYLVDDLDGKPMCGVLSGSARFTERLTLGYRDAVAATDSPLHVAGDARRRPRIPPHGSDVHDLRTNRHGCFGARERRTSPTASSTPGCTPAYLHVHAAAHPEAASRFVAAAAATSKLAR